MLTNFSPSLREARYAYCEGPLTTSNGFCDDQLIVNCQFFAHIVLEELGFGLPKWLLSAELYRRSAGGKVWVDKVLPDENLSTGDVLLFSKRAVRHIQDPLIYQLHLGVCIDAFSQKIVHASRYLPNGEKHPHGGKIYEQTLCDILKSPRYNTLNGIRRPIQ